MKKILNKNTLHNQWKDLLKDFKKPFKRFFKIK